MKSQINDYKIKALAAYLPQFHPVEENNKWWGKGFTEWTNVAKARPLFQHHAQPRVPADLGYYDLRVAETRQAQAELARSYGIHGFMYWHYWFGGKRLLERPFCEVVDSGKPNFPFCLSWANQTWKGTWHGLSNNKVLIEQTYPGEEDYVAHFYALLNAFQDPRYIEVNGKKLFFIFKPLEIPNSKNFVECWQNLAIKEGFNGMHIVGMHMSSGCDPANFGYDAFVQNWLALDSLNKSETQRFSLSSRFKKLLSLEVQKSKMPRVVSYREYANEFLKSSTSEKEYPLICCDWDNTPRSGKEGWLFSDFSLELFEKVCYKAFESTKNKPVAESIVIIKSWNEWAEGNYIEPDQKYGHGYLEAFKRALDYFNS